MLTITCSECNHQFQIDAKKIPGSTFKVRCPSCSRVFQAAVENQVSGMEKLQPQGSVEDSSDEMLWLKFRPEMESLFKDQMEAVKNNVLLSLASMVGRPGTPASTSASKTEKRALICEPDRTVAQEIESILQRMGYSVESCTSASESLSHLERDSYSIITTNYVFPDDPEGGQKILTRINSWKPDERRKVFLTVISDQIKTMGAQAAFFHGANMSVNKSELSSLESMMQSGMEYFSQLYSNYNQILSESTDSI